MVPPLRGPTRHNSARKKNRAASVGMTEERREGVGAHTWVFGVVERLPRSLHCGAQTACPFGRDDREAQSGPPRKAAATKARGLGKPRASPAPTDTGNTKHRTRGTGHTQSLLV